MSLVLPIKMHRSEIEWRELYEEHLRLGISMNSYCKSKGIAVSSYIKWYRKFSGFRDNSSSKFKELLKEVSPKELSKKIEIELDIGSGIILRIMK